MAKSKSTSKIEVPPAADTDADNTEQTLRCVAHCSEIRTMLHRGYVLTAAAAAAIKDGQLYTARDLLQMVEEILGDRFCLNMLEQELGIDTRPKDEDDLPSIAA